jgi:hypothetical protein
LIVGETRPASRRQGDKTNVFFWAGPARCVERVSGGLFIAVSSSCRCCCRVALDAFWWQVVRWLLTLVGGRVGGYQCLGMASRRRGDKTDVLLWAGPARDASGELTARRQDKYIVIENC